MLYKAALLAAVAFLIPHLHVFRPPGLMRAHSQDLANAVLGSTDLLISAPDPEKDRNIVVLLADEESLRMTGSLWPPSEGYHAAVLRELQVYQPGAVFIDFLLMDRRDPEGAGELKQALLSLASQPEKSRVYVPSVDRYTLQALDLQPDELNQLRVVGVRHTADATDSITRQYPWFGGQPDDPRASAAVLIYCDSAPAQGQCPELAAKRFAEPPPTFELMWNTRPHAANRRWHARDCVPSFEPGFIDMVKGRWRSRDACPSVATVFVSDLIAGTSSGQAAANTEQLLELLRGSVVMYGSAFRQAGDTVVSGVIGEVPGAYYHAMALENLQAFDGEPKSRRAYQRAAPLRSLLDFVFLIGLAALFLHRQQLLARQSQPTSRPHGTLRTTLIEELAGVPVLLVVAPLVLVILVIALSETLRLVTLVALTLLTIATEILRGTGGNASLIGKRAAIYAGAVLMSLVAMFGYGWFSFHVMDEPPLDWLGLTAFITFGWFLANGALGGFVDDLWNSRLARLNKESGDTA